MKENTFMMDLNDKMFNDILNEPDEIENLELLYFEKIKCEALLIFKDMMIEFTYLNKSDLHFLEQTLLVEQQEFGSKIAYDVAEVFDCFYKLYRRIIDELNIHTDKDVLNNIIVAAKLLDLCVEKASNNTIDTYNYIDLLNGRMDDDYKMIKNRSVDINPANLSRKPVNDFEKILSKTLQNEIPYIYECDNIYQICFAIIDYLFKYGKYKNKSNSCKSVKKYNLKACGYCGKYFITDDNKKKYCDYTITEGKSCSQAKEADRKKEYQRKEKSEIRKIEYRIKNRLSSYSSDENKFDSKKINDSEIERRNQMFLLWKRMNEKNKAMENYEQWLKTCIVKMNDKSKGKYEVFYEWLKEME